MRDVKYEVNQQTDSLAPIQDKDRIMGWGSYLMLWLGGCISIGTLTMGSAQLDKGLNLMQVFLAVLIGSTILVIGICANDRFSYKSGAPYAVQLKSAYGTKGNIVPVMIRGLPAIVWYGFQTWLGGSAINQMLSGTEATYPLPYSDMTMLCCSSSCSRWSRLYYQ